MILLDTHIWVWAVQGDPRLTEDQRGVITENESAGLGVSIISCWEVAKLVEVGRLALPLPTLEWIEQALAYPGIRLLDLTPRVAVTSTELPGEFHRDPADQILVATALVYDVPIVTADRRIIDYAFVRKLP